MNYESSEETITCPECGVTISADANECPNCKNTVFVEEEMGGEQPKKPKEMDELLSQHLNFRLPQGYPP